MLTVYIASVTLESGLKLDRVFDLYTVVINQHRVSITHSKKNLLDGFEKFEEFLCKISKLKMLLFYF